MMKKYEAKYQGEIRHNDIICKSPLFVGESALNDVLGWLIEETGNHFSIRWMCREYITDKNTNECFQYFV